MAVAYDGEVTTHVDVSKHQECGPSLLEIVANGVASEPVFVVVK
jgi:hypothetical protein